jgi:tol-pal system protein YbgF
MLFSKKAMRALLRIPRLPLLAAVTAAAVVLAPPLSLGAEDKDLYLVPFDRPNTAVRNEPHIAQGYGRPPGEIGESGDVPFAGDQTDAAQLLIRIGRIESQIRQINGQIEEMQFENRKLEEQFKKFQEDVDFRFHEGGLGGPAAKPLQKRSEAPDPQTSADAQFAEQGSAAPPPRASGRGDASDPSQNPAAPWAPRQLGSLAPAVRGNPGGSRSGESAPSGLDQTDPGAPLDLTNGRSRTGGPPVTTPSLPVAPAGAFASRVTTPGGTVIAAVPNSAREQFDVALAYLKQRAYEDSEKGFAGFLEANPKSKLASDAIYYLGESFYLRGRQREAAEQYLKISTQYANSPRAPEALLRLGQSLNALGAKEQACATYGEIARKYPNAPSMVKVGAEREAKRAQC